MLSSLRILCLLLLTAFPAFSQVMLPYSINTTQFPSDSAPIVPWVPYFDTSNTFMQSGFHAGDIVPDFTLYDTSNHVNQLSWILSQGKPVLLASVSLTCPLSRRSMVQVLPDLVAIYGGQVNFVLVYTVEAHPESPDYSPYFDTVDVTQQNINDSIFYRQPVNYYQRKTLTKNFMHRYTPNGTVKVLIDDPANHYWYNFGPAPNNVYILTPAGRVYSKYGWMSHSKPNLVADLAELLNTLGVQEQHAGGNAIVYPNPSNGESTVYRDEAGSWSLAIYDLAGRCVASEATIEEQEFSLGKFGLAPGTYMLRVRSAGHEQVLRFIQQ